MVFVKQSESNPSGRRERPPDEQAARKTGSRWASRPTAPPLLVRQRPRRAAATSCARMLTAASPPFAGRHQSSLRASNGSTTGAACRAIRNPAPALAWVGSLKKPPPDLDSSLLSLFSLSARRVRIGRNRRDEDHDTLRRFLQLAYCAGGAGEEKANNPSSCGPRKTRRTSLRVTGVRPNRQNIGLPIMHLPI